MPAPPDPIVVSRGAFQALGWFFENSKDGFLAIEGETIRRANPVWTALTGHGAAATENAPFWRFIAPEDAPTLRQGLSGLELAEQFESEIRVVAAAGEPLWARVTFVLGGQGWLLAIVRDIRAERRLRQSEARFRGLVNATTDVVFRMSADWSEALDIHGRDFGADTEAPSAGWLETYLLPEEQPRVGAAIAEAVAGESLFQQEVRVRRVDGSTGWALSRAVPIRDETGEVVEWFGAASDITERRRAEEHLRLMVDELNHRVKNTLASIEAAARQAFRNARSLGEAEASLKARITALAHATDLLTGDARVGRSLRGVVETAVAAHADVGHVAIAGEDVELPPRAAHTLTLAVHELATNAVKHGALGADAGRVDVSWTTEPTAGGRRLRLEWRERGGPPVSAPTRRGFGARLIERSLSADEGGAAEFRFEPGGLICVIDAPLTA